MTNMEWLLHLKNVGERFGYKNVLEYVDFHMKRMTIETAMKEHMAGRNHPFDKRFITEKS